MANTRKKNLGVRHARLRKKVAGTTEKPRLAVHFSGQHIYAQIIDDSVGKTLASVNTTETSFKTQKISPNAASAAIVGKLVAERAKSVKVTKVVFDRGGFIYHGKVKALADSARENGLEF
jgi:large subunit ribosomal protein L18